MRELDVYQDSASEFATYPNRGDGSWESMLYPIAGLASEVGEVCDLVKKAYRSDEGGADPERIRLELGDVLWYVSELASLFGLSMSDVANGNLDKLDARRENGTIKNHTHVEG